MASIDGRVQRGERNRQAIADALLACYEAGELRPSIAAVAERAGVSVRSVHNHFADVEELRADVSHRQWERHSHLVEPVAANVDELVDLRAEFFEAVTPVRRAALLEVHRSPTIAKNLGRLDRMLRRQLEASLPTLTDDALDAADALLSWDTWNRLRSAQGCSVVRAKRVLVISLTAVLEGNPS